jgi:hypothetical protein
LFELLAAASHFGHRRVAKGHAFAAGDKRGNFGNGHGRPHVTAQDTQKEPRTPFPGREGVVVRIVAEGNQPGRVLHHAIGNVRV